MASKQRVLSAVDHRQPDRVPVDFGAHGEVVRRLREHLGLAPEDDLLKTVGCDLRGIAPRPVERASDIAYADHTIEVTDDALYLDVWRVGFRRTQTPTGAYVDLAHNPLAELQAAEELDAHPWPRAEMWNYAGVRDAAQANGEYAVWGHSRGFFEIAWFMRGAGQFLIDLALEPHLACGLMDRVREPLMERARRILEAGGDALDIFEYNDDVAGQTGLMMSPELWRKHLQPRMAAFVSLIRGFGVKVRYHSCGGVREILPDLIEMGVDILCPVQPLARGMELPALKRDFGRDITFDGGLDIQEFLPRATPDEVRDETRRLVEMMGEGGGYIAGPSHNLQPDTPAENIVALYETLLGRPLR